MIGNIFSRSTPPNVGSAASASGQAHREVLPNHRSAIDLMEPLGHDSPAAFAVFKRRVESKLLELERLTVGLRGRLVDCSDRDYAAQSLGLWARWVDDASRLHPEPDMRKAYRDHLCQVFYEHCRPVLARKPKVFGHRMTDERKLQPIVKLEQKFNVAGQASQMTATALMAQKGIAVAAGAETGFYLTDRRADTGAPKARLTFNFDSRMAPRAVKAIGSLYRDPRFHSAKIRSPAFQGRIGDNALMYLAEPVEDVRDLHVLLSRFPHLDTDRFVPPGTLPLDKPGVGYSEFPDGCGSSHMVSRKDVLLDALAAKDADTAHPHRPLQAYLDDALERAGLEPARPWARTKSPIVPPNENENDIREDTSRWNHANLLA